MRGVGRVSGRSGHGAGRVGSPVPVVSGESSGVHLLSMQWGADCDWISRVFRECVAAGRGGRGVAGAFGGRCGEVADLTGEGGGGAGVFWPARSGSGKGGRGARRAAGGESDFLTPKP